MSVSDTKNHDLEQQLLSLEEELAEVVNGLKVKGVDSVDWLDLPKVYSRSSLPVESEEIVTQEKVKNWPYLREIKKYLCLNADLKVGLLIGANCPTALQPIKVIPSQNGGPYAYLSPLGWCVVGPVSTQPQQSSKVSAFKISVYQAGSHEPTNLQFAPRNQMKETEIPKMLQRLYEVDQVKSLSPDDEDDISQEDVKFLKIMKDCITRVDGHYQLPLPLRDENTQFPANRWMAMKRAESLKRKLRKNSDFHADYTNFMNNLLQKGYAELAPINDDHCWFIPHHGVYHPTKKKIRVVFDCSAEVNGYSLNKQLLQGPDLTNQLIGVLIRFRQERVAVTADIESMFYQVRIPPEQRRLVRFLWWEDGNIDGQLLDYQMCVHIFGGSSSPSCSNFALRQAAVDGEDEFGIEAAETLNKNFYVDDLLKSIEDVNSSAKLIKNVIEMCNQGGFRLTKFISNEPEALCKIPSEDIREEKPNYDMFGNKESIERALGVHWCIENDTLGFRIVLKDNPVTRRGILSTVSSIYDPLGFASPFLLTGKRILQRINAENLKWDDPIPFHYKAEWDRWKSYLPQLEKIQIERCFKPQDFGNVQRASLHHFSDASEYGYGQCSYLKLVDDTGKVNCSFVLGKSRVAPNKPKMTIPRLELIAAALSTKVGRAITKEIDFDIDYQVFWTDSEVTLSYIKSDVKRFKVFVANRITYINQHSRREQWQHVLSADNPADEASRGINADELLKTRRWFHGPEFLWDNSKDERPNESVSKIDDNDPELRKAKAVFTTKTDVIDVVGWFEGRHSKWLKLVRIFAYVQRFFKHCRSQLRRKNYNLRSTVNTIQNNVLLVEEIEAAKKLIIRLVQEKYLNPVIKSLTRDSNKGHQLDRLNPFVDKEGLLRVGGRLQHSSLEFEVKHPVIVPKDSWIATLIIRWCHQNVQHQGRGITTNEVRDNGFWIINIGSLVRSVVWHCVLCRMLRGKFGIQQMSSLPADRVEDSAPFSYCGLDLFGPFYIKVRRSEVKRYGVMFTCLSCRAVHLEVAHSLDTDSFIMSLRRFIARRGAVRMIRSDNGTNFVGADKELQRQFDLMNHDKIENFLKKNGADWIIWKRNPPYASHHGGVWERQIRTARSILNGILLTHSRSLNEESFSTVLCEVECVINSRPLTVECLYKSDGLKPISPNMLLTTKSKIVRPPPGVFDTPVLYSRRHWKRVQHLVEEFWTRWRKEFLQSLQVRNKWKHKDRNFIVNDIVLLKTDAPRNEWPIAIIVQTFPDKDNVVRTVKLRLANSKSVDRPISKIILLKEAEN